MSTPFYSSRLIIQLVRALHIGNVNESYRLGRLIARQGIDKLKQNTRKEVRQT